MLVLLGFGAMDSLEALMSHETARQRYLDVPSPYCFQLDPKQMPRSNAHDILVSAQIYHCRYPQRLQLLCGKYRQLRGLTYISKNLIWIP
jgi:hypothetical protein